MPTAFILISALLVKHYLADFVLQPQWMLRAKGNPAAPGGYAHAAFHAIGTGIVLAVFGSSVSLIALVMAAEAVVHFAIDFVKDRISDRTRVDANPRLYWQLHGLDQLAHQMTYVVIAYVAVSAAMA